MSDPVELEITRGLVGMRDKMGIPQPRGQVIDFPIIPRPTSRVSNPYGRLADGILAIEAIADLLRDIARQAETKNIDRANLIEKLRSGEHAARQAAERLEN